MVTLLEDGQVIIGKDAESEALIPGAKEEVKPETPKN